jgi:UDPglucose--hexose-1-phosphate uridylyltransferase
LSSPELRIDQLTGMRTILAPARAERPDAFTAERPATRGPQGCPLCEGSESETPPEVFALRAAGGPDTPGWLSRVVPNLYPALAAGAAAPAAPAGAGPDSAFGSSADPLRATSRAAEPDLFASRPATGAHEVIVNAPRHLTSMAELSDEEIATALATWRERMRVHEDGAYTQLIVNEGGGAGASLEHTHAQLYALPFVPPKVARERERVSSYRERTAGGGLLSDILAEEVRRGERLVAIDEEAALICPWASRSPFELRLLPRRAAPRFEHDEVGASMLARALRTLARRFDSSPGLNLWVRTAPHATEHFHWHIDIAPRLTVSAGFEMATGVDINVYPPERAAADLRGMLEP